MCPDQDSFLGRCPAVCCPLKPSLFRVLGRAGYTGVFDCEPTANELHRHRQTLELGETWLDADQAFAIVERLQGALSRTAT